jgi:heme A synthase
MTYERGNLEGEEMEGAVGRHGPDNAGQRENWYSFSFLRTLQVFAVTCALLWFLFILIILPSQATRPPPLTRELHIYITFLNVLIVLLVVRGWRAHLLFVPIWLALLWLFFM